jgi:hypothetical protein
MDPLRIREGMQQNYILFMFVIPITMVINKKYRLQVIYFLSDKKEKKFLILLSAGVFKKITVSRYRFWVIIQKICSYYLN